MAELKTRPNDGDVEAFLQSVEDERRRRDCRTVVEMLTRLTGEVPRMWGGSIIGFGSYEYAYESGRTGTWMRIGCSPRKQSLTLYIMSGVERYEELLRRLGTHRTGKSCLYVNRLEDIDLDVLEELVVASLEDMDRRYPTTDA